MRFKFTLAVMYMLLMFSIVGCGNGTTTVGNSSESISVPTITIGQLIDGASTIEMSLGVFGADESALDGASFDIKVNGVQRNTNLDPFDFFISSSQLIQFRISPLKNGDELEFIIRRSSEQILNFIGKVSATDENIVSLSESEATYDIHFYADEVEFLVATVCNKIQSCYSSMDSLDNFHCQQAMYETPGYGDEFGPAEDAGSLVDISKQINNGLISVSDEDLELCMSEINAVTCETIESVSTIDVENEEYAGIENFLPEQTGDHCPAVFKYTDL